MLEILNGTKKTITANLCLLAEDYKQKTGRVVCLSCPSDIQYMISSLKTIYKMNQFEFKKNAAQYKNKKGDRVTISNGNMTDEKAIEFLRTNPERIRLFSVFPKDWETLIQEEPKSEEQKAAEAAEAAAELEAKKASGTFIEEAGEVNTEALESLTKRKGQTDLIESIEEQKAINEIKVEGAKELSAEEIALKSSEEAAEAAANKALNAGKEKDECCDDEHDGEPCEDCKEKKRQELSKMKLADLRKAYPEIKATSIKDFVEKVVSQ